jgi:hypothetical protein
MNAAREKKKGHEPSRMNDSNTVIQMRGRKGEGRERGGREGRRDE